MSAGGQAGTISVPASVLDQLDFEQEWLIHELPGWPDPAVQLAVERGVPSLAKVRLRDPESPDKPVLNKPVRIHDLRHACASWLLGAGVSLIVISGHFGNEDTATTARINGHLDGTAGQAAAAVMANLMTS